MTTDLSMERAIRAWTLRHSGTWLDGDETELQAWLTAASEHREAYEKVARAWMAAGDLKRPAIADQKDMRARFLRSGEPYAYSVRRNVVAACVAVLAATVVVPLWSLGHRWWHGSEIHLATPRGQPKSFVLDDGTEVLLDANSELFANIGARGRHLSLTRGEALFTVSHDASHPFEVASGAGRVTDVGTQFDIEALARSTRVSVLEGRVGVLTSRGETLLVAGQAGGYDKAGNLIPRTSVDTARTRWSTGQRHFDGEPLTDVLERLARYHAVTFEFTDDRLRDLHVSGTFRIGDLALFLRTLGTALPIEVRYLDPQHVEITPRAEVPGLDSQSDRRPHDRR